MIPIKGSALEGMGNGMEKRGISIHSLRRTGLNEAAIWRRCRLPDKKMYEAIAFTPFFLTLPQRKQGRNDPGSLRHSDPDA